MDEALFQRIATGATVVTATRRLAREIGTAYDRWQRERGHSAWPAACALPLAAWLREQWAATWPDLALPAESQVHAVWEGVIRADLAGRPEAELADSVALARLAAEASHLAVAYRLPAEGWTDEERGFLHWRTRFQRQCAALGWLDPATVTDAVAAAVTKRRLAVPGELIVAGFDRLTPAQEQLLAALRAAGCRVDVESRRAARGQVVRAALADPEAEVIAAARWLRQQWRPGLRFAVVVPDLEARRPVIERIFTAELAPAAVLPDGGEQRAFDLSLGPALARHPVVAAALGLLEAVTGPLPFAAAARLLADPFVAADEGEIRFRAELNLRQLHHTHLTLRQVAAAAHGAGARGTAARLASLAEQLAGAAAVPPSRWARLFAAALGAAGWPGPRSLTSAELQAVTAWNDRLAALATLDPVVGALSLTAAVARLRALCRRPFQPEGGAAPVQVMGLLEAGGLRFDGAWVMGLDATTLPAAPRCHPLLSAALQRRCDLPHATAAGELVAAYRLVERLTTLAPLVVLTAPRRVGEGERSPSPLIVAFPEVGALDGAASASLATATLGTGRLAVVAERPPPPLPAGAVVRGGARVIEHQSLCPFRAFATHTLAACTLEPVEEEPTARTRGILVHAALEQVWQELGDHAALVARSEAERTALCTRAAQAAVGRSPVAAGRRAVVAAHLAALLGEWLAVEAARPPFAVAASEQQVVAAVGGLQLDLRVDRVDRLADGATLVIDYKTGEARTGDWWDERPAAPQLPLYAAVAPGPVAAVAFAKVTPGGCRLAGVGDADAGPGVVVVAKARGCPVANWVELVDRWRTTVERLAHDFAARVAAVDPLRNGDDLVACAYCDLAPLCRIHEREG
jgi:ATP-dependent helicase/nuclease subunit B